MRSSTHRPRSAHETRFAHKPWLMSVPVLLFSLAGCGLKGPLYLPDDTQQEVPASTAPAKPAVLEGSKVRTLPPAPQSQKKDRERASPSTAPSQSQPPPVSPPDPDRPATTPPPPGQ